MANRIFGQRDIHRQNRQRARAGQAPAPLPEYWRPKHRADCVNMPRPCPYVSCKHHLFLDVTPRGGLRVPYGEEPEALAHMPDTCALDVADRGGVTLEKVARLQAITRERVRQIELMALRRLQAALAHIQHEGLSPHAPVAAQERAPKPDLREFLAFD